MEKRPWTALIFISVLVTVDLGLLSLILTVIVDRAAQARQEDQRFVLEQRAHQFEAAKKSLRALCLKLDKDGKGSLSKEELVAGFNTQPEFEEAMLLMDVNREDVSALFAILDEDVNGNVAYDEFVEQLHKMKSQDLQMMLVFLKSYIKEVRMQVDEQLKLTKSVLVEQSISQEARTKHIVDLLVDATSRSPSLNSVFAPQEMKAGASAGMFQRTCEGSMPARRGFPKLPQGRLADALEQDLHQLRQQLSADLATATCSVVDAAISELLGPPPPLHGGSWASAGGGTWRLDEGSEEKSSTRMGVGMLREPGSALLDKDESLGTAFMARFSSPGRSSPGNLNLKLPLPLANTAGEVKAYRQASPSAPAEAMAAVGVVDHVEPRVNSRMSSNTCCSAHREERPQMIASHHW